MKRFYKQASARPLDGAWQILLDDRPVKTPARNPLVVPTEALGRAIAAEWDAQGEKVDPRSMPLTGLANAAIDRVAPDRGTFARGLASYGESDLLCYRAEHPNALVERQAEHWDPILAWARRRFDIDFEIVCGVMHKAQHEMTLKQLDQAVAARDPFELAALAPLVTIAGSLVIALALAEEAVDLDRAWTAATVDEAFQAEHWGEDAEATAMLDNRRRDFEAGYRFLTLLKPR
ncbi:ATP12 family chaperone protein [Sphingosinicella sp. LY1275]|uniref:ATP12 family chaperone protein n=1 Tax=Sphingosinicella sp. LY1275 TaxID=3095379 RepID=UPI002ADEB709|nr:ATP12 family protein [Sphingosinicella sp. LY1275]MEA1014987.1 ATP12 family protein [Sphingosinicella sp. LY1275]